MSGNSFGTLYCVTSFGESHGPAYGGVVDGCPPGLALSADDIQRELDRRKPGSSRHVTQRRESSLRTMKPIAVPVVRPSYTPERISTASDSRRCVTWRDEPGFLLSSSL